MTTTRPPAEFAIDRELIRTLLKEFVPQLADETIELVGSGWDAEIYRLGPRHAMRIPRRKVAAELIDNEQRWLPEIERHLPLPIPTPVHAGSPAFGFPWSWSIVKWLPGVPLIHSPALDQDRLVTDLAGFLNALHVSAPDDAPVNPVRGTPLAERDEPMRARISGLEGVDHDAMLDVWEEGLEAPPWDGPRIWLHGDMHPGNLLVRGGRLSGVIDFGDITAGDPATDFMVAWMLFDEDGRGLFRNALEVEGNEVDVGSWTRARAWALAHASAILAHSSDDPTMRRMGETTLRQVLS